MTERDPEQRKIVVKLNCTLTFEIDLMNMLRREFDADVRWLIDPIVTKAYPEPLQDAMLAISAGGSLLYIVDFIRNQIREAQRDGVADDAVSMGFEGDPLEDIDEFVDRLLEDEE